MGDLLLGRDLLRQGLTGRDDPRWRDAAARHAALTEATCPRLAPGAVVSHVSAAIRHGLPVWGAPLRMVHVSRDRDSGERGGPRPLTHSGPLPPEDVVLVDGLPTTSVARTVLDVARSTPFETAVTVADAALHTALVTPGELATALLAAGGRRGVARARAVLAFADGLADGPGESRSRVRMDALGVVAPVLQHVFDDAGGQFDGRVGFWWPRNGIVGEFDGMERYGRTLRPDETPADAVEREKRREDALRARPGIRTVVRWTWDEIPDFTDVADRLPRGV